MTVKPWVTTVMKSFIIFLLIFLIATIVIFIKGMNDRITVLERFPAIAPVVVITPEPTATPSATIKPIRRVTQPVVVPSK